MTDRSGKEERSDWSKDNAEEQEPLRCRGPGIPSRAGEKLGLDTAEEEEPLGCVGQLMKPLL